MDFRAPHPLVHPSHAGHPYYYPGLQPASTKAQPTSIGKSHRPSSGVLPQGHTPGPGPGGQQNSRSFAAALRNLAKQAGPAPQEEEPRASPKNRAPPPLVRGPSPAKERSTHERRPEEMPSLYTTARPVETSKHSVTAAATELLARSGFQPYRPEHHPAHPPAFALDPATYGAYHSGLYPPPHLPHAYRLEEQLYFERCGMIRPQLFPGLPSYPLYGLRYSPDMLPPPPASLGLMSPVMHERLKLEEEHRRQVREQAAMREEEERRRAVRSSAPAAPVPAPAPASADTAARKPTIAAQMHSDRDRERDSRERQSSSGGGGGNSSSNASNTCGNSTSNTGNSNSNISGPVVSVGSNHHQSRKEEQQSSVPSTAPPPPPPDPTAAAAAVTIYHPRLPPFPSSAAAIGPTLGSTSICSASSAPIPPPLGSTLPPLNLGPPPPAAINSAPICPPIPSIPSLTPGVIGPPQPPPLSLGMSLPPIISIPSLHLPPVPSSTIHSSQHTIMSSATTTVTSSIYHQQQQHQQSSSQQQQQHQPRANSTSGTTSSLPGAMTTHAVPTPPNSSSLNSMNHMVHKSPPLSHGIHVPRSKEPPTTTTTAGTLPTTATVTTTTSTTTTSQPAFVRPFEDSFRSSSTKTQQRHSIMNSHNHSIVNQIGHHEPSSLKNSSMTPITSQTVGSQVIQENSSMDNKSMSSQQTISQPIPTYPSPQQYHHPHIPVSHVPSLYKPPHFSTSSSSSSLSSPHQQHHSQPKLNIPTINTSNSSHSSSGGTSVINSTNSNITKQQNAHHVGESHQTTTTMTSRNDSATNCVSSEKTMTNISFSANTQVSGGNKIANNTNAHHKSNSDVAAKDNKLNAGNEKSVSENIIRQPQLPNQNHVATNSLQEKTAIPHLPYEQQGKKSKPLQPVNYNLGEKEGKNETDCTLQCDQNNVLSTLPFQPNFKFSIKDIAQKPMDTTQLMQSIKSEEVLRTCQNVSNVLLQIPKYQEKLLNFSTSNNELKTTAFCFTDKCNNLTEISVKCDSAVLNVPDLSKALGKQDVTNSEKSFLMPEMPTKELTSSLDLAEKRRKRRREKNTGVTCSSDSEGEEETKDVDLWITKGPPAKLQYSEDKLAFLAMFGLTTLTIRNEIELCKVEKRYKLNPDPPELPLEIEPAVESILPIPREHPDVLLHTPDFAPKVGFLRTIGLDIMPPNKRDEAEVTWQYVLADRKKRKSANSVTAYCERIAKVYSRNPPALPKSAQKMRLLDRVKVKHTPERPPPLPPLGPKYYSTLPMPGENGVKQHCKAIDSDIDIVDEMSEKREKPRWTGIVDVMFAYSEYLKEKTLERKILTSEKSKLMTQSDNLRSETAQLDRKLYELLSARTALDSERRILSEKIERINALVRKLR